MILEKIRQAAEEKLLFLSHAIRQMSRPERMISAKEIERVVKEGDLVEDYPQDSRGHSCLIMGWGNEQQGIHVVWSPKEDYLAIITAYIPDPTQWSSDLKRRLLS